MLFWWHVGGSSWWNGGPWRDVNCRVPVESLLRCPGADFPDSTGVVPPLMRWIVACPVCLLSGVHGGRLGALWEHFVCQVSMYGVLDGVVVSPARVGLVGYAARLAAGTQGTSMFWLVRRAAVSSIVTMYAWYCSPFLCRVSVSWRRISCLWVP